MNRLLYLLLTIILCSQSISDPIYINGRDSLIELSWSKTEIQQVSNLINHSHIYINDAATEKKFKSIASDAKLIHFATHAIIDDINPLQSKLILKADKNSEEDGLLNVYELYSLQLNSELVVLSACNTGVGKLIESEGLMSLARGFKYAGCPSLIVSLWSIDDRATSKIMQNFYQNLTGNSTIVEALRKAKLEYINSAHPDLAAPYYWASLIAIGKDNRIQFQEEKINIFFNPAFWGLIGIMIFGGVFILSWQMYKVYDYYCSIFQMK